MRVVVVGAGIIGASCAYFAARAGLDVTVVDREPPASGTTSRGEGNILVSDKSPGPELDLALLSQGLWVELARELGESIELEPKGGLVVAPNDLARQQLSSLAAEQATHGVQVEPMESGELRRLEPHLAAGITHGVLYPQDLQVQPVRATTVLLTKARARGARVAAGTVLGLSRDGTGRLDGVRVSSGDLPADVVVNATGTWAGAVSESFGAPVPVLPRRGFVLVTEPLPVVVRHKVYSAEYVANVAASSAGLETSAVVESTVGGTILIGASRERVGFDPMLSAAVVRQLAAQAIALFPFLARVHLLRTYHGFRPYCPDHLPVIGWDQRVPGLIQAAGHEGAGIGLAPATGLLVSELITGRATSLDVTAFDPARFAAERPSVAAADPAGPLDQEVS